MLCQAMGEKQEASSAAPSEKAEGETGNLKPDSAGGKICVMYTAFEIVSRRSGKSLASSCRHPRM